MKLYYYVILNYKHTEPKFNLQRGGGTGGTHVLLLMLGGGEVLFHHLFWGVLFHHHFWGVLFCHHFWGGSSSTTTSGGESDVTLPIMHLMLPVCSPDTNWCFWLDAVTYILLPQCIMGQGHMGPPQSWTDWLTDKHDWKYYLPAHYVCGQ